MTTLGIIYVLVTETLIAIPPQRAFFQEVSPVEFFTGTQWTPQFEDRSTSEFFRCFAARFSSPASPQSIGLPIGLAGAIYLSEYASPRTRELVKPILEILAGIPTVVYGYCALVFVTPYVLRPIFHGLFGFNVKVFNAASAGIVVAIMIIPIVTSLSEDALRSVPQALREAAYALGLDQVSRFVQGRGARRRFPACWPRFLLAISRAVGETMAVAIAAGQTPALTLNPFRSVETMTAFIVNVSFGDKPQGSLDFKALFRRRHDALRDHAGDEHPFANSSCGASARCINERGRQEPATSSAAKRAARRVALGGQAVRVGLRMFHLVRPGRPRDSAVWAFCGRGPAGSPGRFSPATTRGTPSRPACWRDCGAASGSCRWRRLLPSPSESGRPSFSKNTARKGWLRTLIEINLSNLAGVPSIVYGILGMAVFVKMFGMFRNHPKVLEVWLPFASLAIPLPFGRTVLSGALDAGAVDPADRDRRLARGACGPCRRRSVMRRTPWERRTGKRSGTRSCRPPFPASSPV